MPVLGDAVGSAEGMPLEGLAVAGISLLLAWRL